MKTFIKENFLINNDFGGTLYHQYAKDLPIIDYHCHLPPDEIAENKTFSNLTQIWLNGDHYKWRAMRALGINEKYITGDADDKQKFLKWAEAVPHTMRNPLYHWTHLELLRYFNIDSLLDHSSSEEIYENCNTMLNSTEFSTQNLISNMNIEMICTTDDPVDNLEHHIKLSQSAFSTKVLPAFRPDKAFSFSNTEKYNQYLDKLEEVSGVNISTLDNLLEALKNRIDFFHENGCRLSDHGISNLPNVNDEKTNPDQSFLKIREGKNLTTEEQNGLMAQIMLTLCKEYAIKKWTQQFHLGALRNTNTRMENTLGPDTGFDSIGDYTQAQNLAAFLDKLDQTNQLPKTILYNLNPAHNEVFATMAGNYNDGTIKGKMQYGSAWWYLDQKDGIEKQLNTLSNMSVLSTFIGMLTDSRSFLSYPRHEYFRRILCNLIGQDVENGELPNDEKWLGKLVQDICYNNVSQYIF